MACHRSAHCLPSDRPLMSANTVSRSRWSVSLHRFINVPGKRRRCTSLQVEPLSTCEETKRPRRRIPALDGLCIGQLLPCHDRSHGPNNRRHSTYEPAQPAELTPWALFAHKMPPNFWEAGHGLICVGSAQNFSAIIDTRAPPRVNSRATKTTEGVTGPRRFAPWASQKDSL